MNNKQLIASLRRLGLTADESAIYITLLQNQSTHQELARKTGVNRTKVYRIAEDLEKRSLINKQTDDRGTFLIATDPGTLDVEITNKEQQLQSQRDTFVDLLPELNELQRRGGNVPGLFEVNTYEGVTGMKQMLWHELKAKNEVVIFGSGTIEKLVDSRRIAEKHRSLSVDAGYLVREIINPGKKAKDFTSLEEFKAIFSKKLIPETVLLLEHQIVIYNDTVAVYSWRGQNGESPKVGYEVINKSYAHMMRQMFDHYWTIAE